MIIRDVHENDTLQLCQLLSQLNYDMDLNAMKIRIKIRRRDR